MLPTLQESLEDYLLELKFIKFRCLTEMGISEKKHTFEEQHTQPGIIKLSESEPSHLFLFSYICYPTHTCTTEEIPMQYKSFPASPLQLEH